MADFDKAIAFVLRDEDATLSGKVTTDVGGRTRFGVAERFHPDLGDEFFTCPAAEALNRAKAIYRADYWPQIAGDYIESDAVAAKVLDMAVNMGVREAKVLLQRALNASRFLDEIAVDGIVGDKTVAALNAADPENLISALCEFSAAFYQHVAAVKPEDDKYLQGWLARARHVPQVLNAPAATAAGSEA